MGKFGRTPDGVDYTIKVASPDANPRAEILEAERKKVELALRLGEEARTALLTDDYDTAIDRAQIMCTAIVHAANAAQIAARYFPESAPPSRKRRGHTSCPPREGGPNG